jgi:FAD/FMN-containing dehydrogenase
MITKHLVPPWAYVRTTPRVDPHDAQHNVRLHRVVDQLRQLRNAPALSLRKRAVSHVVPKRDDKRHTDAKVDISALDEILHIDPVAQTCTAEPGVTFVDLVKATLKHGLVPTVVPELKTITVGGAVTGCSIESMSFVHGGFHDSCIELEVVTADGEVLRCTRTNEHALLFEMIHGSFGTLGVLTKLVFRLVPAKAFVHVRYDTFSDVESYQAAIRAHYERRDVDFMDGIIHSPTKYVLCLGTFVDRAPYTHNYDWLRVYWQSTGQRKEDYLTTLDYFFRYDRGVTAVYPKSFLGRLFFGRLAASDTRLRLAHALRRRVLPRERPPVIVDTFVPFSRFADFLRWSHDAMAHYPLWVVPYRRVRDYGWIAPNVLAGVEDDLFLDVAFYGVKQPDDRNLYREMEEALPRFNAIKTLISYNYYDEDEFWRVIHRDNYFAAKQRVDPDNRFRDIYTKTCKAARGLD